MKISLEWLRDYVKLPPGLRAEEIAHSLTMATVEVEQVIDLAAPLAHVVVGHLESVERHPQREGLSVIRCDIGAGKSVQLVSAAVDPRPGQLTAVALPGAKVRERGGDQIVRVEERDVHGVSSAGMICGAPDLELEQLFPNAADLEVMELSDVDAKPGRSLAEAIGFADFVLEIDNKSLTNRPDLLGHRGIAREVAAIYSLPLEPIPRFVPPEATDDLAVEIENPRRCRRYTATRVTGLNPSRSPFWLRSRLTRAGQRPINLAVDLTNYVMLAVGQPSHAFESGLLKGAIVVRQASPREELQLLDGESLILENSALVIADQQRAVALAGIMGGKDSAIGMDTRDSLLEIANFEPSVVRQTATRLGIRTESSMRFEKGLDPALVDDALGIFFETLARSQPEARATGHVDIYPSPIEPSTIDTTVDFINRRLGDDLPQAEIVRILERLGFGVLAENAHLKVTVPSWRATGDVSLPEDLVEEVGRLFGYDKLTFVAPQVRLERIVRQPELTLERRIKEYLAGTAAMQEIVSYPWVEDRYVEAAGVAPPLSLATPPAPTASRLQPSLIPQMLAAVKSNLRFLPSFRLFEVARVFPSGSLVPFHEGGEMLPPQPKHLAAALAGPAAAELFLRAKGILEALPRAVQMEELRLENGSDASWAEPHGQLTLHLGDRLVGRLGAVSARTLRLAGIRRANVALFELDLTLLRPHLSRENQFEPLPVHPQKEVDLSLLVPAQVRWADVDRAIQSSFELVRGVRLVEEYRGAQVPPGKKSLLVHVILGAPDRTLEPSDVEEAIAALAETVVQELGAEVRGAIRDT